MERITGVVQHYAWGDTTTIPRLLGRTPDGRPAAELWFGTHPGGPATVADRPLAEISDELPYLLKVLAADQPLSLQTHPSKEVARLGFESENQRGIAVDAPERIYRDPNPKPELICALTPFDALCGFRPPEQTVELLERIGAAEMAACLREEGLEAVVHGLYRGTIDSAAVAAACATRPEREAQLVVDLERRYPGDRSVAVTLLLNRLTLAPGEALYLDAGNLHAYLAGTGVEIMGASDNVVRGGLTTKHVDVDELLAVLDVTPLADPEIVPTMVQPGLFRYDTPRTPFRLWRIDVDGAFSWTATGRELWLATGGDVAALQAGSCAYVAPGEAVTLTGHGTVFRVEELVGWDRRTGPRAAVAPAGRR